LIATLCSGFYLFSARNTLPKVPAPKTFGFILYIYLSYFIPALVYINYTLLDFSPETFELKQPIIANILNLFDQLLKNY
jgi:hypothetical protein